MRALVLAIMLLLPTAAEAQLVLDAHPIPNLPILTVTKPLRGMSGWAKWVNYSGAIATVVTQEYAFYHYGVYDKAVKQRVTAAGVSLGTAVGMHLLSRWMPRSNANAQAVVTAGWGWFSAGRNIHVLVTIRRP